MTAGEPEQASPATDWPSELKTLVAALSKVATAAGVGGLFGVVGWFVQTSQDNLFGIRSELASNFATTYLLLFAQFIIDCLRSVLVWHVITVIVAVLLITLIVLSQTLWRPAVETWLKAHLVLAACVVLMLVSAWATYFVMPSFLLSDLLFENAGTQHYFDVGLLARFPAQATWNEMVESRPSVNCGSQNGSQWKLESRFSLALMLLAFFWWSGLLVLRGPYDQGRNLAGLKVVIAFALIGATLLVPYVYGKLILPTCFPVATVVFRPGSGEEAEIKREAEGGLTRKSGTQQQDAEEKKALENAVMGTTGLADFLLVREYPDKYILYHKHTRSVWPVRKSDILAMRMGQWQDLLAVSIKGSN